MWLARKIVENRQVMGKFSLCWKLPQLWYETFCTLFFKQRFNRKKKTFIFLKNCHGETWALRWSPSVLHFLKKMISTKSRWNGNLMRNDKCGCDIEWKQDIAWRAEPWQMSSLCERFVQIAMNTKQWQADIRKQEGFSRRLLLLLAVDWLVFIPHKKRRKAGII